MCLNVEKNIYKMYTKTGTLFHCCNRNTRLLCPSNCAELEMFCIVTMLREKKKEFGKHCCMVYGQCRPN